MDGEGVDFIQGVEQLLAGRVMGVAYSGFRVGQHPDRGQGAVNPTAAEISEDLDILLAHGFDFLRLYDCGENSETVLRLITERGLPIKVLLGAWLAAEVSNHEGCPWLDQALPEATLAANRQSNAAEIEKAIRLANRYGEVVVALNVGNEALVEWNDHMVSIDTVIDYVRAVRSAVDQPVTVAENYAWWHREGARLAGEVDFIGVHSYPAWEGKTIDEALACTRQDLALVRSAFPDHALAILEAGWATTAMEFPEQASEQNQLRYFRELRDWATAANLSVLFFEAFDEPWKGAPEQARGAEKHWGLFHVDRSPKQVMRPVS